MNTLPANGSVLGIDIGFSERRRSGGVCRLTWDNGKIDWVMDRFRYRPDERLSTLEGVIGGKQMLAAAFDGPLRSDLEVIGRYRLAEKMLTVRFQKHIGKPGQSSSPVGNRLNQAANEAARDVLTLRSVGLASHVAAISDVAIVEAFPTTFLGLMLAVPDSLAKGRAQKSDRFFVTLSNDETLVRLVEYLLPGRAMPAFAEVTNHDDRAALVCAITALAIAANDYTAVGGQDGWIVLPPWSFIAPWACHFLQENAREFGNTSLYRSAIAE